MKLLIQCIILGCCALTACQAAPPQQRRANSIKAVESPATRRLKADSPAQTDMPVIRPDTARQADMPVVVPPKNIQPK